MEQALQVLQDAPGFTGEKHCPKCDTTKRYEAFGPDKRVTSGLKSWCRECDKAHARSYYQSHKEQHKQTMQRIKQEKHEEYLASHRLYNEIHQEQLQAYRAEHTEDFKAYYQVWRRNNGDRRNALESTRRTRKTQAGGSYTAQEWNALKERYGNVCLRCKSTGIELTADHVIPVSKGGVSDISNIQPLCRRCNAIKGTLRTDYRR